MKKSELEKKIEKLEKEIENLRKDLKKNGVLSHQLYFGQTLDDGINFYDLQEDVDLIKEYLGIEKVPGGGPKMKRINAGKGGDNENKPETTDA